MKKSILATVAAIALMAGAASVQAGENDVGLKASGNGAGPGGDVVVKVPHATTGAGVDAAVQKDRMNSKDPADLSRNRDLTVVPNAPAAPSGPASGGK
jgi:hypothetical protein